MARDDYNFLVFKVLTYLYGCLQRKFPFEKEVFLRKLITLKVSEEYLCDVLRMMQQEELIEGLVFIKAWGNEYLLANEYSDMRITVHGTRYLLENDKMEKVKKFVLEGTPGAIMEIVKLVHGA